MDIFLASPYKIDEYKDYEVISACERIVQKKERKQLITGAQNIARCIHNDNDNKIINVLSLLNSYVTINN